MTKMHLFVILLKQSVGINVILSNCGRQRSHVFTLPNFSQYRLAAAPQMSSMLACGSSPVRTTM